MIIIDQPEQRSIFCLKTKDSFMGCSICTLLFRVHYSRLVRANNSGSSGEAHCSSLEQSRQIIRSIRNKEQQLYSLFYPPRDVSKALRNRLGMESQNRNGTISQQSVTEKRNYLIMHTAQDLSPSIADFEGLLSYSFNVYKAVTYDKLHLMDLGLIRFFCDQANAVIQHHNHLPLARLIHTINQRYDDIPSSSHLPFSRPFCLDKEDFQEGMSGKSVDRVLPSYGIV